MIKVNYEQTRAAARKLNSAASECSRMANKVNQINSIIPACWEGSAASTFSAELTEWVRETSAIQSELVSLASDIIRIAREFEDAEARLAAETNSLGGGGFW